MKRNLETFKQEKGEFTIHLTADTRVGSKSSNIKIWISKGEHLITMSSQTSVDNVNQELANKKMDFEWCEFTKYENDKDYL